MVLLKDFSECATNFLTKNNGDEGLYEIEYVSKNKNINFTNNSIFDDISDTLKSNSTIQYSINNVISEIKVNKTGISSFDVKYKYPSSINKNFTSPDNLSSNNVSPYLNAFFTNLLYNSTFSTKIENKFSKLPIASLYDNYNVDLCCEYNDMKNFHSKLVINPFSKISSFSFAQQNDLKCGLLRIGAEIKTDNVLDMIKSKYMYSFGMCFIRKKDNIFTMNEILKTKIERVMYPSYIFTWKVPMCVNLSLNKVMYSLQSSIYIKNKLVDMACEFEQYINNCKYVRFNLVCGSYIDNNQNTYIKFKSTNNFQNICVSLMQKINNNISVICGCSLDTNKMATLQSMKYGFKLNIKN